jgi:hypothetical protein
MYQWGWLDLCRLGDGLLPNHHFKLCTEMNNGKIFEDLNNRKNMVFNVKKLLYDGGGGPVPIAKSGRKYS